MLLGELLGLPVVLFMPLSSRWRFLELFATDLMSVSCIGSVRQSGPSGVAVHHLRPSSAQSIRDGDWKCQLTGIGVC